MTKTRFKEMIREAEIQASLNHEGVLKVREIYLERNQMCIVTDLMEMDALSYISDYYVALPLSEHEIKDLLFKLLMAVNACHQ